MDRIQEEKSSPTPVCDRIPTLTDLEDAENDKASIVNTRNVNIKRSNYVYRYLYKEELTRRMRKEYNFYNICILSVCLSFTLGLSIGILLMGSHRENIPKFRDVATEDIKTINSLREFNKKDKNQFAAVSFTGIKYKKDKKDMYPKGLTEDMKDILKDFKQDRNVNILVKTNYSTNDKTVLFENIFWGPKVENMMPQGYGLNSAEIWERYVNQSEIVKMENGCGRMQNRLVTFRDGIQACVRYRQNTDQIQGEIFSFYVARLINLTNLAPSVIKIVDVKDKLWQNVANDIASAEWNSNRAVVLTQYIPSLEPAKIPDIFKPSNRHLNKNDVLTISLKETDTYDKKMLIDKLKSKTVKVKKDVEKSFDHIDLNLNKKTIDLFVELAQWSDLIIFDYLTANLDRIVNNLFNFQWNINIMDGPAHNLARKVDSGLLVFLDNESGLLHGYRLLKKYTVYHSAMLDNLCVFRKSTIDAVRKLYSANVGVLLSDIFHKKNDAVIRDILPPLPEKNAKVLHERLGKVLSQVEQCKLNFSKR